MSTVAVVDTRTMAYVCTKGHLTGGKEVPTDIARGNVTSLKMIIEKDSWYLSHFSGSVNCDIVSFYTPQTSRKSHLIDDAAEDVTLILIKIATNILKS